MIEGFKIPQVTFRIREGDTSDNEIACAIGGKWTNKSTDDFFKNKRVILFSLPGAFTPTCSSLQLPGFENNCERFKKLGIDEIYCLVVNDIHVTKVWAEQTGGAKSGLKFITDTDSSLVNKLKLSYSAPDVGLINRSKRFCIILDDLIIKKILIEEERGVCNVTSGENILTQIDK